MRRDRRWISPVVAVRGATSDQILTRTAGSAATRRSMSSANVSSVQRPSRM